MNHQCLSYSYVSPPDEWHLVGADGEHMVKVRSPIVTSHRHVLRAAAVRGVGIAYGPIDFFRDDVAGGRLTQVLPDFELPRATIYAVYAANPKTLGQRESFQRFHGSLFRGQPDLSLNLNRSGIFLPAQSPR